MTDLLLSRDDLKLKFQSGDTPTGSDYNDWITTMASQSGSNVFTADSQTFTGSVSVGGAVSANMFYGDGSGLTNVGVAGQTPWISNIDGGGYSLTNVSSITANEYSGGINDSIYLGWNPGSDGNLGQNTDVFPIFSSTQWNTNSNIFELVNSGSGSPVARVFVKTSGYYMIISQGYAYDFKNNTDVFLKIWESATSGGDLSIARYLNVSQYETTNTGNLNTVNGSAVFRVASPGYYTMSLLSTTTNPYALQSPGNNMFTMSLQITKLRGL